jgi:uncharacterized protein (TIGR00369 family)
MSISLPASNPLNVGRIEERVAVRFPQLWSGGRFVIEDAGARRARVRMKADPRDTRPGGTISGPAMFTLADFSVYVAVIASLGEPGFEAVTASMTINFLAKPEAGDLTAHVTLIRVGRRLAVGEVELYSQGVPEMVAHATANYALPSLR